MGFIQLKLPKRLRLKLPNTSSLRKAREEYRQWLKERGLDKLKPRKTTGDFKFDPGEERTGVPLGNKIPVSGGKKREQLLSLLSRVRIVKGICWMGTVGIISKKNETMQTLSGNRCFSDSP